MVAPVSLDSARVIGSGSIGNRYVRLLAARTGTRPWVVPVGGRFRDPELATIARLEAADLDHRPLVDLTVVATRTGRHVEDYLEFGPSSRTVLIEKPIAPSYALGQVVADHPAVGSISVSAPLRFMVGYSAVKDLLPAVGRITGVTVVCQSWLPGWRPGSDYRASYSADPGEGGVLRDLVHEIDYSLSLFGAPYSLVAELGHSEELDIAAESSAALQWRYPSFALEMRLDYVTREARRGITIEGESGTLRWNVLEGTVCFSGSDGGREQALQFPDDLSRDDVLMRQLEAATSDAGDPRLCTVADGLRAIAICDAARESDRSSSPSVLAGPLWDIE